MFTSHITILLIFFSPKISLLTLTTTKKRADKLKEKNRATTSQIIRILFYSETNIPTSTYQGNRLLQLILPSPHFWCFFHHDRYFSFLLHETVPQWLQYTLWSKYITREVIYEPASSTLGEKKYVLSTTTSKRKVLKQTRISET